MKNFLTSINYIDSWELAKKSFCFLGKNKDLNLFPGLNLLTIILFLTMMVTAFSHVVTHPYFFYGLSVCLYLGLSFIVIYLNTVFITIVLKRLAGESASLQYGFKTANKRLFRILKWALLASTLGLIAKFFESTQYLFEQLAGCSLGFSWGIATYFMLPLLIDENVGLSKAMQRSTETIGKDFKKTISVLAIAELFFIVSLLLVCEFDIAYPISLTSLLLTLTPVFMITFVLALALEAIVICALYLNTIRSRKPRDFDLSILNRAFVRD